MGAHAQRLVIRLERFEFGSLRDIDFGGAEAATRHELNDAAFPRRRVVAREHLGAPLLERRGAAGSLCGASALLRPKNVGLPNGIGRVLDDSVNDRFCVREEFRHADLALGGYRG